MSFLASFSQPLLLKDPSVASQAVGLHTVLGQVQLTPEVWAVHLGLTLDLPDNCYLDGKHNSILCHNIQK